MDNLFDPNEPVQESVAVSDKIVFRAKPYFSWSRISMFLKCGEQYRRAYVQNDKCPPTISLACGSSAHHGIEMNMRSKLLTGKLLHIDEVIEITKKKASEIIHGQGIRLLDDEKHEVGTNDAAVLEHVQNRSVIFSRLHHSAIAPYIDPLLIEHSFRLVTKNFPFDLVGIVDLQEKPDGTNPAGAVRDVKTTAAHKASMADDSDQLTLYGLWGRQVYGYIPPLKLDQLVATKQPKAYTLITHRNEKDIETLSRRIECVANALEKEIFLPAPSDHWACSPKYCGYAFSCPYYRRRVTVPVTEKVKPPKDYPMLETKPETKPEPEPKPKAKKPKAQKGKKGSKK